MAKRKAPAKKAGKKLKAPKGKRERKAGLRQPALAGMSQIRSQTLDRLCESIGAAREEKNKLTTEEAGDAQAALKHMLAKGIRGYVHMGVRLTCKKGVDKLGITLLKDKSEQGADIDKAGGGASEVEPGPEAPADDAGADDDGGGE